MWRARALSWSTVAIAVLLAVAIGAPSVAQAADTPEMPDESAEMLDDLLTEAKPEEIEQRRRDIAGSLAEAGSAREFVEQLEEDSALKIEALDAELQGTREMLALQQLAQAAAEKKLEKADENAALAEKAAADAEVEMRSAAVDVFMNPPQGERMLAALSGTIEEEMASTGLLVGRAEARREIADRHSRAEAAAAKAATEAASAAKDAGEASRVVADTAAQQSEQLDALGAELSHIRETIAALETEVADLFLADSVLRARLELDALVHSGSVSAVRDPHGSWIPDTDSLPGPEDMVHIPGTSLRVHRAVALNVAAMVSAAAVDGVTINGGAYRDSRRQVELRIAHCGSSYHDIFEKRSSSCSPPTARPGQSMHERGLALDLSEGGGVLTRSSAAFRWLSQNAAKFGFYNLPSEPWHWSVNGR